MITIDGALSIAETAAVRYDAHMAKVSSQLLQFDQVYSYPGIEGSTQFAGHFTATACAWGLPHATYEYALGADEFDPDVGLAIAYPAQWHLGTGTGGGIANYGADSPYRLGVMNDGTADWVYYVLHYHTEQESEGSGIELRRLKLVGTPVDEALGDKFGTPREVTETDVTIRVAAVIPLEDSVIIALTHSNTTDGHYTMRFYRYERAGGTVVELTSTYQAPLPAARTDGLPLLLFTQHVTAIESGLWTHIVFNGAPNGAPKLLSFWKFGSSLIERRIRDIVAFSDDGVAGFTPNSLIEIDSTLYLAGRMTYTEGDGTATGFDCYLVSEDALNWSVCELSSFICEEDVKGSWILDTASTPAALYYAGMQYCYKATLSAAHYSGNAELATQYNVPTHRDYSLRRAENQAARLNMQLRNANGELINHAVVKTGALLTLLSGQEGSLAQVGVYEIETSATAVDEGGYTPLDITATDRANKALLDYSATVDVVWQGQGRLTSDMADDTGLVVKAGAADVAIIADGTDEDGRNKDHWFTADGLRSKALCNPLIAYADVQDSGNTLQKATIRYTDTGSLHSLRIFSFLFGAGETGKFFGVTVPSEGSYNPQTKPRIVTSALEPAGHIDGRGTWNLERRNTVLLPGEGEGSAMVYCTEGTEGSYTTDGAFAAAMGSTYDIAARLSGRRLTFYRKLHELAEGSIAANAEYELITDWTFSPTERLQWESYQRPGFVLNTDTWHSKAALADASVGDVILQLTTAQELNVTNDDFTIELGEGTAATHPDASQQITSVTYTTGMYDWMRVGMLIRCVNGGRDQRYKVTAFTANTITVDGAINITSPQDPRTLIYLPSVQEVYAQATSGYVKLATSGDTAYLEPGARQQITPMKGRAAFFADSGAAISPRHISSNGVTHSIYGGEGATTQGWDATNPIADGTYYYSGSDPAAWRMAFTHGWMFDGSGSEIGLPDSGYMMVDDEIVRYVAMTLPHRSSLEQKTVWSAIPAYYSYVEAHAQNSGGILSIRNVKIGSVIPGDRFDLIPDVVGMAVRIISTENDADSQPKVGGVLRVTDYGTHDTDKGYIELSSAYTQMLTAPVIGKSADLAIVSGRAQLDTDWQTHDTTVARVYYPVPIGGTAYTSLIDVDSYAAFSGVPKIVQDALRHLCATAGVHDVTFCNYMTGDFRDEPWYTTFYTARSEDVPLVDDVADFTLDGTVQLSNDNLIITFRGYYQLYLSAVSGGVRVGLATTDTAVTAAADGVRWLEFADVPFATLTQYFARICAHEHLISVSLNDELLWQFDLRRFVDDDNNYARYTADVISVSYDAASVGGITVTFDVPELWQPVRQVVVAQGDGVINSINQLCDRFAVYKQPTYTGGIKFTRHSTRDVAGTLRKRVRKHKRGSASAGTVTHARVLSNSSGGYLDGTSAKQYGYRFAAIRSSYTSTAQESREIAKGILRDGLEAISSDVVEASGRVGHEVGDVIVVQYLPPNIDETVGAETVWVNPGVPWVPYYTIATEASPLAPTYEGSFVVEALSWRTNDGELMAEYTLRAYEADL